MARKHTIYGLYDPSDAKREVRYVGATKHGPEKRLSGHIWNAQHHKATYRQKWIRKLLRNDLLPAFLVLEVTTAVHWKKREQYWIAELTDQGCRLTNSTEGGEGLINPSKDVRKRIGKKVSKLLVGNQRAKGLKHTEETKRKISEGLKNSKRFQRSQRKWRGKSRHGISEEARAKLSLLKKGVPRPDLKGRPPANKGWIWVNNGTGQKLVDPKERLPRGYALGMLGRPYMVQKNKERVWTPEQREKVAAARRGKPGPKMSKDGLRRISERKKNSRWITNGVELKTIQVGQAPPSGWSFGRKLRAA